MIVALLVENGKHKSISNIDSSGNLKHTLLHVLHSPGELMRAPNLFGQLNPLICKFCGKDPQSNAPVNVRNK